MDADKRRNHRGRIAAVLLASAAAPALAAQSDVAARYPDKPVRLVIASAPGGGTDVIARLLAHQLTESWRQQIVPDNRSGGGGVIATDILAKAAPDGHTLLVQSSGITYAGVLYLKLPYDLKRDIAPVALIATQPFVLTVHPSIGAISVAELVRVARAKPGSIRFGSGGVSGASHLAGELFRSLTRIDIVHVPYKGTGPATTALLSGEIHMLIAGVAPTLPHIRTGRLRALGVTGAKRVPALPDVPTIAEGGVTGYQFDVWYGLFAPAGTAKSIVEKLNAETNRILRLPEIQQQLAVAGADAGRGSSEEFARYVADESVKWMRVIREAGIRGE